MLKFLKNLFKVKKDKTVEKYFDDYFKQTAQMKSRSTAYFNGLEDIKLSNINQEEIFVEDNIPQETFKNVNKKKNAISTIN